jgi:hypothetical protein
MSKPIKLRMQTKSVQILEQSQRKADSIQKCKRERKHWTVCRGLMSKVTMWDVKMLQAYPRTFPQTTNKQPIL